ncbi:MAG: M1 family aminopeptidase, partial [Bacteroidota bacterium]
GFLYPSGPKSISSPKDKSFPQKIPTFKTQTSPRLRIALVLLGVSMLSSGAYLLHQIHYEGDYLRQAKRWDRQADYEKKYQKLTSILKPDIVDLKSQVDLFPSRGQFRIQHRYTLENKTQLPISEIWITSSRGTRIEKCLLEKAKLIKTDAIHGVYHFRLSSPLAPGQQIQLDYHLFQETPAVASRRSIRDLGIVANGSNLMNLFIRPSFGYRSEREISDPEERKKRGLAPKEITDHSQLHGQESPSPKTTYDLFSFEATLSTDLGQIAIAPGQLLRQWQDQQRAYFHYQAKAPINHFFAYLSADYEVHREDHQGIQLEIYHAPGHDQHLPLMAKAMKQTLDYCQVHFSPYPLDHLRIAEIPGHWPVGGYASKGLIGLTENRAFFTDLSRPDAFDLTTKRVVHEVAHQWFGHQLNPQSGPGASLLVESLTKYVELVILDQTYGHSQVQHLVKHHLRQYFTRRSQYAEIEPPMDQVEEQSFLFYDKGAWAMNALRERLGEAPINQTINQFMERHAYPHPKGNAADFIALLKTNSPIEKHSLIDDYLSKVIYYDKQIDEIQCQQLTNEQYEITLHISAKKWEQSPNGQWQEVPFQEAIPIAALAQHPDQLNQKSTALWLQDHLIKNGSNQIRFQLAEKPTYVSIDPFLYFPDRDLGNDVKRIEK